MTRVVVACKSLKNYYLQDGADVGADGTSGA